MLRLDLYCPYCNEYHAVTLEEISNDFYCANCEKEIYVTLKVETQKMMGVA